MNKKVMKLLIVLLVKKKKKKLAEFQILLPTEHPGPLYSR